MLFKINHSLIMKVINTVSKAINNSSPHTFLQGIKFEILADKMIVTGSDADLSIQTVLPISDELIIEEEGGFVINSRFLSDIIRKFEGDIITFENNEGILIKIYDDNATYSINGLNIKHYPKISFSKPANSFTINSEEFSEMINKTIFATSLKETRAILTGINLKYDANDTHARAIATDSYRLAKTSFALNSLKEAFNITVPRKALLELFTLLTEKDDLEIALDHKKIMFTLNQTIIQSQLIDGEYPETKPLIPKEFISELTIDRKLLYSALERAAFVRQDGIATVKLSMNEKEVMLSTNAQEIGSFKESLKVNNYVGKPLTLSFSHKYVNEALRSIQADEVILKFSGELKPFLIVSENDQETINLVLPVRSHS